jgi:murein L,D-transpeptidase YafK
MYGRSRNWLKRARARTLVIFVLGFCLFSSCATTDAANRPPSNLRADRIVVVKSTHTLTLLNQGSVIKTYKIALGGNPKGAKIRRGDHKTPEGEYILDHRNEHSQFYRSIHISYPNREDRARARKLGVSPGGDVMLHGLPNGYGWIGAGHRARDWTDGCIAVTNEEMDEIWRAVPDRTVIEIRP